LHGRNADVEERPVDFGYLEFVERLGKIGVVAAHERNAAGEIGWHHGIRIAIERNDASACTNDRAAVTARAERSVEVEAAGPDRERLERFGE
jgi:hypothetical protein